MQETHTETISITESRVLPLALLTTSFLIPFFVSGPQLLVGILVNMFLFLSIRFFGLKRTVPMLFLPSIGATFNGIVFGVFSKYLLFFLPFIWVANFIMIRMYDTYRHVVPRGTAICMSAAAKSAFLFVIALVFVRGNIVPPLFIQAMGVVQFVTACIGGIAALVVESIILKSYDRR
jgi:hypothetical protein